MTQNENGTDLYGFDSGNIVNSTAVIVIAATPARKAYTGTTRLFSTKVAVSAHTGTSVTLSGVPHSSWGDLRVYYFYDYPLGMPQAYQIPSKAVAENLFAELQSLFLTEEEISATAPITYSSQTIALDYDTDYFALSGSSLTITDHNRFIDWTDASADLKTSGTGAFGEIQSYNDAGTEYLKIDMFGDRGRISTAGTAPTYLELQEEAHSGVKLFSDAEAGQTQPFNIYGLKTGDGDAKRVLRIRISPDYNDTASFESISNYYFDGNLDVNGTGHDSFTDFVANEHIDWTNATDDFLTTGKGLFGADGIGLYDGGEEEYLYLKSQADSMTADRTLGFDVGNANRIITLEGDSTLGDWFDQSVKVAASPTFDELTLTAPTQDYLFTNVATVLALQSQTSSTIGGLYLFTKDGDATDQAYLGLVGMGTPASLTDYEILSLAYQTAGTCDIFSSAGGSGTLRPLHLYTGANTTQLVLNTDGSVSMAGALGAGAITGTSFIIGGNTLDTNEWAVLDGVTSNMVLDWTSSGVGTIDATNIEDKFLRNDGNDVSGGGLTLGSELVMGGNNIQNANVYITEFLYHYGDGNTAIVFGTDTFYFLAGGLQFLAFFESDKLADEAVFNEGGVDIDLRVEAVGQANALFVRGSDGVVGIRNASPSEALDVTGTVNATAYKIAGVAINTIPKKLYVSAQLLPGTGSASGVSYVLNATEYVRAYFRVPTYIDDTNDIGITFSLESDKADATYALLIYVGAWKTDNTENVATVGWNIEDGTGDTFGSSSANTLTKYQYTLGSSGFSKGDLIGLALTNNEGGQIVKIYDCVFEMDCLAA